MQEAEGLLFTFGTSSQIILYWQLTVNVIIDISGIYLKKLNKNLYQAWAKWDI
jgi:hypothetical protein